MGDSSGYVKNSNNTFNDKFTAMLSRMFGRMRENAFLPASFSFSFGRVLILLAAGVVGILSTPFGAQAEMPSGQNSQTVSSARTVSPEQTGFLAPAGSIGTPDIMPSATTSGTAPIIDFGKQLVLVWGVGGQPWEEQVSYEEERSRAWMDALHHAYEETLRVPLMEGIDVRNVLRQYPTLRPRMGRILLAAPRTFFEEDASKLIRCRVELPFTGIAGLRSALFLAALHPQGSEPRAFIGTDSAIATDARLVDALKPPVETSSHGFSRTASPGKAKRFEQTAGFEQADAEGLPGSSTMILRVVVDLRETFFEPSLFPRFFDEEGRLIYQEGRIPSSERFSRPVVRFSQEIADATAGLMEEQIMFAAGRLPILAKRDIVIRNPDDEFLRRFCRRLDTEPFWKGEILVIHGNRVMPPGAMLKITKDSGKKGETGAVATPGAEGAKPAPRVRTR
ncbi:MAG: hypothetical protein WA705_01905 [Candidatus Ozemobacteraceae bacterium]